MFNFEESQPEKYDRLSALAKPAFDSVKSDHWISHHPGGDSSEEFCLECCKKSIEHLHKGFHTDNSTPLDETLKQELLINPPTVDGGWGSDYDCIPTCHSCGALLTGNLTDTAIDEELYHYEMLMEKGKVDDATISSPEGAYNLIRLIDSVYNDTQKARLAKLADWFVVKN